MENARGAIEIVKMKPDGPEEGHLITASIAHVRAFIYVPSAYKFSMSVA